MSLPKVVVPLAKGFEEIEAVGLVDVLRRGGIEVIICTLDMIDVEGAHGIIVKANRHIETISSDDITMIVLPGGGNGTQRLANDRHVQKLLQEMNFKGKDIGAICAAPLALDKVGVLKEGYTCYPGTQNRIKQKGYNDKERVVQSENIITSQGPGTVICFALAIIKRLVSLEKALEVEADMLVMDC